MLGLTPKLDVHNRAIGSNLWTDTISVIPKGTTFCNDMSSPPKPKRTPLFRFNASWKLVFTGAASTDPSSLAPTASRAIRKGKSELRHWATDGYNK